MERRGWKCRGKLGVMYRKRPPHLSGGVAGEAVGHGRGSRGWLQSSGHAG